MWPQAVSGPLKADYTGLCDHRMYQGHYRLTKWAIFDHMTYQGHYRLTRQGDMWSHDVSGTLHTDYEGLCVTTRGIRAITSWQRRVICDHRRFQGQYKLIKHRVRCDHKRYQDHYKLTTQGYVTIGCIRVITDWPKYSYFWPHDIYQDHYRLTRQDDTCPQDVSETLHTDYAGLCVNTRGIRAIGDWLGRVMCDHNCTRGIRAITIWQGRVICDHRRYQGPYI